MHLPPLVLTTQQRDQLESVLRRPTSTQRAVERALIVFDGVAGRSLQETADRLGFTRNTVRKWRRRFILEGISGLEDQRRPGRPRRITAEERCLVLATACQDPAPHGLAGHSSWNASLLAQALVLSGMVAAISARSVQRVLKAATIKPHRCAYWKQKIDPLFAVKMRPIIDLCLHPPPMARWCARMRSPASRRPAVASRTCFLSGRAASRALGRVRPSWHSLPRRRTLRSQRPGSRHGHAQATPKQSSSRSSTSSTPRFPPGMSSTWCSTASTPTADATSRPGAPPIRVVSRSTTCPFTPVGSIRSSSGSGPSPAVAYAWATSARVKTWRPRSWTSLRPTTAFMPTPTDGPTPVTLWPASGARTSAEQY